MDLLSGIPVTAAGVLVAIAFAVGGAPLFALGRKAFRLRGVLRSLAERPLTADLTGWVNVRGRVELLSPMFAPLSGRPCAGFQLEVSGENSRVGGTIGEWRSFRLQHGDASVFVSADSAEWHLPVTDERTLPAADPLPERIAQLLDSNAETRWLRDRRAPLHVVERALEAGATVSVLGVARHEREIARIENVALAATGTDDGLTVEVEAVPGNGATGDALWLAGDGELSPGVRVFTDAPDRRSLEPSPWLVSLLGVGPVLTVAGLLYLARAAGPLVSRRF